MSTPPGTRAAHDAKAPPAPHGRRPGALSREAIARVDPSGQLGDVLALPEHLRDALWRVESAIMQDWDTSAGLVVAGMGGSAIGGALARAALGDHASRPIFVTRAYGLPPWTTPGHDGAVRELLGRHRGDARLLRVRRARSARSAWWSPPAGAWPRWRAPTACP